ncbi:hypothetical protein NKDENANG_00286 [Candidatus Entotheonellaceae bacterium PAL068K]
MANDSSRRALQNAFSLIYGLSLPSLIYAQHSFSTKLTDAGRILPKVHLVVKNRLTQYMGPASAYDAVLQTINKQLQELLFSNPNIFTFNQVLDRVLDIRDFGTTGVVAFAKGQSFQNLVSGRHNISGRRVQVKNDYRQEATKSINRLVELL